MTDGNHYRQLSEHVSSDESTVKKHIVLAWELGAALGHVMGFRGLVTGFLSQGCTVSIVGRNLCSVEKIFSDLDITYYQSPVFLAEKKERLPATHSYSDIIYDLGYESEGSLMGLVKGWNHLFSLIKPDLIICDHSPTALLSSACLDIPSCTFGNGFFIPPDSELPVLFQKTDKTIQKQVLARYKLVLKSINKVLDSHSKKAISSLYDLFRPATHFLCTFAETDHYSRAHDTVYYGPRSTTNQGRVYTFAPQEKVIFAYLQPYTAKLIPLLSALAKLPMRSILYIPRPTDDVLRLINTHKNLSLTNEHVNVESMFTNTMLLVSNGSHGLVNEALVRGIPAVLFPTQLEQNILAKKLSDQKLALAINNTANTTNIEAAINFALTNKALRQRLCEFTQKYADHTQVKSLDQIISICMSMD